MSFENCQEGHAYGGVPVSKSRAMCRIKRPVVKHLEHVLQCIRGWRLLVALRRSQCKSGPLTCLQTDFPRSPTRAASGFARSPTSPSSATDRMCRPSDSQPMHIPPLALAREPDKASAVDECARRGPAPPLPLVQGTLPFAHQACCCGGGWLILDAARPLCQTLPHSPLTPQVASSPLVRRSAQAGRACGPAGPTRGTAAASHIRPGSMTQLRSLARRRS